MIISNNPNLIIHQASFSNTHQQLKSDLRPKATEKNTGCFRDMLQRVKNIELNKLNSVNKSQEIWKSLKIDTIRTSYTRMAEQLFPVHNRENINFNVIRRNCVYIDNSFSIQPLNQNIYDESTEIKRIDLFI